jgi:primosomal protein N' (replication factor Y)
LIRVELAAGDESRLRDVADELAAALRSSLPAGTEALGPAPRFRLRGRHRRQILVKAVAREEAVAAVREGVEAAAAARRLRGIQVAVDVDPQ